MTLEDIEILIKKSELNASERKSIRDEADAMGIEYKIRQGCRDCYDKLLLKIFDAKRGRGNVAVSLDGYRFKTPGDSFRTYCGEVFSETTLPSKVVGRLHKSIISDRFVKIEPTEDQTEIEDVEHDGTLGEIFG